MSFFGRDPCILYKCYLDAVAPELLTYSFYSFLLKRGLTNSHFFQAVQLMITSSKMAQSKKPLQQPKLVVQPRQRQRTTYCRCHKAYHLCWRPALSLSTTLYLPKKIHHRRHTATALYLLKSLPLAFQWSNRWVVSKTFNEIHERSYLVYTKTICLSVAGSRRTITKARDACRRDALLHTTNSLCGASSRDSPHPTYFGMFFWCRKCAGK